MKIMIIGVTDKYGERTHIRKQPTYYGYGY